MYKIVNFHGDIISKFLDVFFHRLVSLESRSIISKRITNKPPEDAIGQLCRVLFTENCQRSSPHTCGSKLFLVFGCGSFFCFYTCQLHILLELTLNPSICSSSQPISGLTIHHQSLTGRKLVHLERSQTAWGENETPQREV